MLRVVVMGVAGSGKSSVGAAVAARLGAVYLDGDDLHPPENIARMAQGIPLEDADRAPWLLRVGQALAQAESPVLIGCSALRRRYRDTIRAAAGAGVRFLHLTGTRVVIEARMAARSGHFMPLRLLDSQFAALEPLGTDEAGCVLDIDQPFDAVVAQAVAALR